MYCFYTPSFFWLSEREIKYTHRQAKWIPFQNYVRFRHSPFSCRLSVMKCNWKVTSDTIHWPIKPHLPAASSPKKDSSASIEKEAERPQSRSNRCGKEKNCWPAGDRNLVVYFFLRVFFDWNATTHTCVRACRFQCFRNFVARSTGIESD